MENGDLLSVRDFLRYAVSRFNAAGLCFGHGTENAFDEAAYLILHTLQLPLDRLDPFLDARLMPGEREAILALIERRVSKRLPAAYITREAWLRDYRFYVNERVIVPRSYFAELLEGSLLSWIGEPDRVQRALDLCTGSGCLAVIMAHTFPRAHIDAADVAPAALEVARRNIADYGLETRIEPIASDLFGGLRNRTYDLIISNPPYVPAAAMAGLPAEYRHEPSLALAAGADGLDLVRRIIGQAKAHLAPGGLLCVEVGDHRGGFEAAYPRLPVTWLATDTGIEAVFMVHRDELPGFG